MHAQEISGYVSLLADALPSPDEHGGGGRSVLEMRARALVETSREAGPLRLSASGFAEGLAARRDGGSVRAVVVRPQELHVELTSGAFDVRVGFSRLAWGRLDEVQPTDVINPIDLTRFFFEGRSEARLPVALTRLRWTPSERFRAEGVVVPVFRAGRFDQLNEPTSPFNLGPRGECPASPTGPCVTLDVRRDQPEVGWGNVQGGGRLEFTSGRVDWSASAYRGFESQPLYAARLADPPLIDGPLRAIVDARFPRFTMLGGDFETTKGAWGLRGEAAALVSRQIQLSSPFWSSARARSLEAGFGIDRRAGDYRFAGNLILSHTWPEGGDGPEFDRSEVTLVGVADRSFARETRKGRAVALYDPAARTLFARSTLEWNVRDNWWVEGAGGLFVGESEGLVGQLATRDFVFLRLKVFY
jgi:hypothetical protein